MDDTATTGTGGDPTDPRETLRQMAAQLGTVLHGSGAPARRVSMSIGEVSLEVEWSPDVTVVATDAQAPVLSTLTAPLGGEAPADQARDAVVSPLVGTFYHAPEPGSAPFVAVGDVVEQGQQVGIVEAMKLMNPVETPHSGVVLEILVGDGESVEFEQPLFVLGPPPSREEE